MSKKLEIFDYANSIGCHIKLHGSFKPKWHHANADLVPNDSSESVRLADGWSVFGRAEKVDFEAAIKDLAAKLSGSQIRLEGKPVTVPPLKHTKGYRG